MTSTGSLSVNFAVSYVYRRTFNLRESAGPGIGVVGVCDVDIVATGAFQQVGMKREAEHPFVPALARIVALVDRTVPVLPRLLKGSLESPAGPSVR